MPLPEARVQRWCAARVPEHARQQVRVECDVAPRHLTIIERRAPWRADLGPEWTSFRFHIYDRLAPPRRVAKLLGEIDDDPHRHLLGLIDPPAHGSIHGANHI